MIRTFALFGYLHLISVWTPRWHLQLWGLRLRMDPTASPSISKVDAGGSGQNEIEAVKDLLKALSLVR